MVQISDYDIGVCCFCGDDCSAFSQSCGRCARSFTGEIMGWDLNVNKVRIYYTGIGSDPEQQYVSEKCFRSIMTTHKDKFNEECPYDPSTCDLNLLMEWSGAEFYTDQE